MKKRIFSMGRMARLAVSLLAALFVIGFVSCGDTPGSNPLPPLSGAATLGWITAGAEVEVDVNIPDLPETIFRYQWKQGDSATGAFTNISDATDKMYNVPTESAGKWLQVDVTAVGYEGKVTSNAALVRAEGAVPPTITDVQVSPTNVPSLQQGNTQQFTAIVNGTEGGSPLSEEYKTVTWRLSSVSGSVSTSGIASGTAIDTSGLLTLAETQNAMILYVTATSTIDPAKSGEATVTVTTGSEPPLTGTVTIPGAIKIGEEVTVNTTGLPGSGTISYNWQKSSSEYGPFANIGVTEASYVVSANDFSEGDYIRVRVTRVGYSGGVPSNTVYVRAQNAAMPIVSSITVTQDDDAASISKGASLHFTADVTGTNLEEDSDEAVTWSVNSTNPGTYVDEWGWLYVAVNETAATLTVTATSVVTTSVTGTKTISVTAAAGHVLTITGITGIDSAWVAVLDDLSLDGSVTSVAQGDGQIANGTLMAVLLYYNETTLNNEGWTASGAHNIVLQSGISDIYVYTNGGNLNMSDPSSTPKYSFSGDSSTIAFNLFKKVPIGADGYALTITGISGMNNSMAGVEVYEFSSGAMGSVPTPVAWASGTVSGNTLAVTLAELIDDGYGGTQHSFEGWTPTDGKTYTIWLSAGDNSGKNGTQYGYTNGMTYAEVVESLMTGGTYPTVTFSGSSTSIAFNKFAKIPGQYHINSNLWDSNVTVQGINQEATEGEEVTLTVQASNNYEVTAFHIVDEDGFPVAFSHTPMYATVTFTMPSSNVWVSWVSEDALEKIRYVTVTPVSGGIIHASPAQGKAGTQITLTITPNNNYEFDTVTITTVTGQPVSSNGSGGGSTITFSMPMSDVTVTGKFTKISGTGVTLSGRITYTGLNTGAGESIESMNVSAYLVTSSPTGGQYWENIGHAYWSSSYSGGIDASGNWSLDLTEEFTKSTEVIIDANITVNLGGNDTDYYSMEATKQVFTADISGINFAFTLGKTTVGGTVTIGGVPASADIYEAYIMAYTGTFNLSDPYSSNVTEIGFAYIDTSTTPATWSMRISNADVGKNVGFMIEVQHGTSSGNLISMTWAYGIRSGTIALNGTNIALSTITLSNALETETYASQNFTTNITINGAPATSGYLDFDYDDNDDWWSGTSFDSSNSFTLLIPTRLAGKTIRVYIDAYDVNDNNSWDHITITLPSTLPSASPINIQAALGNGGGGGGGTGPGPNIKLGNIKQLGSIKLLTK